MNLLNHVTHSKEQHITGICVSKLCSCYSHNKSKAPHDIPHQAASVLSSDFQSVSSAARDQLQLDPGLVYSITETNARDYKNHTHTSPAVQMSFTTDQTKTTIYNIQWQGCRTDVSMSSWNGSVVPDEQLHAKG